jgi:hypothetical protein
MPKDAEGKVLKQSAGLELPCWCGVGDPAKGYYAGLPGKAYAKLLPERWTKVFPTGAYWNETTLVSGNRLAAFASDTTSFAFVPPGTGDVSVTVTLLYRRAYMQLWNGRNGTFPISLWRRRAWWSVSSEQWTVSSEQWTVVSEQWTVVSEQ